MFTPCNNEISLSGWNCHRDRVAQPCLRGPSDRQELRNLYMTRLDRPDIALSDREAYVSDRPFSALCVTKDQIALRALHAFYNELVPIDNAALFLGLACRQKSCGTAR